MKKFLFLILSIAIFIGGCATVTTKYPRAEKATPSYMELNRFCKKYDLKPNFNTLDDIIHLSSPRMDIRLLIDSSYMLYNERIFSLRNHPYYSRGIIFIPIEVGKIITSHPFMLRKKAKPVSIKTIVIDPGHGGKDPGAISPRGLKEKYITLKVAKLLKKELQAQGFRVYLTRNKDIYLTLRQRVQLAKIYNADLFISVHVNANRSRKIRGVEVYYLSERYFDSESKAVVMAENAPLSSDRGKLTKDTQRIVWDLLCNENNKESLDLANTIVYTLRRMGFKVRSPRGAPFYVLKYAYVPSVLVEIGYLTNYYEEKLLKTHYYQKQIAHGIALSIDLLNRRYTRLSSLSLR